MKQRFFAQSGARAPRARPPGEDDRRGRVCHLQAFTHDFEEGIFIKDLGSPQLTDRFTPEGKADNVIRMQHPMTTLDSLTCCKFALFAAMTVRPLSDFVEAVTGWTFGVSRKDDTLHPRFLHHTKEELRELEIENL
jgi:aldehyde:ferredoxin oxidoreductase